MDRPVARCDTPNSTALDSASIGKEIHAFAARLFPICRSLTGEGVRQTLAMIGESVPLSLTQIPSGEDVFDWTVPREWVVRDAYIKDSSGKRIVDFQQSNLHLVSYSCPVRRQMTLQELRPHLHSLPEQPDSTPYRTSYYKETWGFCLAHRQLEMMSADQSYDVVVDTEFRKGHLVYGEYLHRGEHEDEVLFSAHTCHPSLANDNCSGIAVLARLAASLAKRRTRFSYRFLFAPGTIGAMAWLSRNRANVQRVRHGLVVAGVGDAGAPTYKRTRSGCAEIDRILEHIVTQDENGGRVVDFSPYGYDERQFGSPGFNMPVGLLQRSPFGSFPEYHTSADNLSFIRPDALANSYEILRAAIDIIEQDRRMLNLSPFCEPQLSKRNLYPGVGGLGPKQSTMATLWVLNLSDGDHTLFDIAERARLPFSAIYSASVELERVGLLRVARDGERLPAAR